MTDPLDASADFTFTVSATDGQARTGRIAMPRGAHYEINIDFRVSLS